MSEYFPSYLSELSGTKHVTVDVDLEGLATKKDLESIAHVDTSSFALKSNLASLKTELDKLHEVKKVDDKVTKNTSDILGFESRLK